MPLVSVENDPFAQSASSQGRLVAVDHDPFQPAVPSLLDNISNDISSHSQKSDDLLSELQSGKISAPEYAIERTGNIGSGIGSLIGDVGRSVYDNTTTDLGKSLINHLAQPVKDEANSFINYADNSTAGKAYNEYMQQNPRADALANAIPGLANLVAPAANPKGITGSVLGDALKDGQPPSISQGQARTLSGVLHQKANDIGAVASPAFTNNKIINAITSQSPQTFTAALGQADAPFTKWMADAIPQLKDKALTLQEIQGLDHNLSGFIDKHTDPMTGFPTAEATPFIKVQQALRSATKPTNIGIGDLVSGSPEALQAWKDGQGVWADSYKLGDIDRINNRASLMSNPSQAMQTGYRQIATSEDFKNLYTPEQQALIRKAATKGLAVRAAELIGSGITPAVGGAIGGVHGAATGFAVGAPFRAMAKSLQEVPVNDLRNSLSSGILNRFPDYTAPISGPPHPPQTMLLPPPSITVSSGGVAKTAEQAAQRYGTPPGTWAARMAARNTTAPVFDSIENAPEVPKNASSPQIPISSMIGQSSADAQQLAKELGLKLNSSALADALLKASKLK